MWHGIVKDVMEMISAIVISIPLCIVCCTDQNL